MLYFQNTQSADNGILSGTLVNYKLFYLVVYPPFAKMVCPVIHHPSLTKNSTKGAMSLISVNPPKAEADL